MKYFILTFFIVLYVFAADINSFTQQLRREGRNDSFAYITLARNMRVSNERNALNKNLYINDILFEDDLIKTTGTGSYGAVLLDSNTAFKLFENTEVLLENNYTESGEWLLNLNSGCILVAASPDVPTTIVTADTTIESEGGVFSVCFDGQSTIVSVLSGIVSIDEVRANDFYSFDTGESSPRQMTSDESILFDNVQYLPGIDSINGLGNLSQNIFVLEEGRISDVIKPIDPNQDHYIPDNDVIDTNPPIEEAPTVDDDANLYDGDYIEKDMRY